MSKKRNWSEIMRRQMALFRGALKTPRGKDVVTYLVFVCVAFVFWLLLSLDTEVQRDYDIPLEISGVPDSVTMISGVPKTINVGVQAKGAQLLPYNWGRISPLKLHFHEYVVDDNTWAVSSAKLESKVRDYFGGGMIINTIRPDSLRLIYTALPGEKVPLKVRVDVEPNLQCIISGPVTADVDSVMVYSPGRGSRIPSQVETELISRRNLKDTTFVEVKLRGVRGVRLIPDRVKVCIPVEPLIWKKQTVKVGCVNLPHNCDLITFPSKIDVSYLVPMSRYNESISIGVAVNFREIVVSNHKAPVRLTDSPTFIRNVSLDPDSVEYVIETDG